MIFRAIVALPCQKNGNQSAMKTTTRLLAPVLFTFLLFSGASIEDTYGQKEEEPPFMLPPQEDLAFEFFGNLDEWDDPFLFPLANPEDFNLPDTVSDWEDEPGLWPVPAPDPRTMKRIEMAWRQMHLAMRRLDREMRNLYRMAPGTWHNGAEAWDDFDPMPQFPRDFPGKFFKPDFQWKRDPALFDTLIENNDTLKRIIILGGSKGDTIVRKSVKVTRRGIGREGDTVIVEREVVRDRGFGKPGREVKYRSGARPLPDRPGPLRAIDIPAEDITRLSKTALSPASSAEPLGIPEINVRPFGKGVIQLRFPARNLNSFEVSLFDENGTLLYQESIKKNSGDYDKRIEVESKPPFFLKISQGKKILIKKIIPDR